MTMLEFATRIYHWFRPPIMLLREPPPLPAPAKPAVTEQRGTGGEFYFRETILDQLDYYMTCIRRMRRTDRDAYELYTQIGGQILSSEASLDQTRLSPWFLKVRPAFGAVFFGVDARDTEEREGGEKVLVPRFYYFRKYNPQRPPPEVQRVRRDGGDIYVVTAFWDKPEHRSDKAFKKGGVPWDIPVLVTPDGSVQMLKVLNSDPVKVRCTKDKRDKRFVYIPQRRWEIYEPLVRWAKYHKMEPEAYLASLFIEVANMYEQGNASVIRVTAMRGDLAAAFAVNIKRTPYFFKDRDVVLGDHGQVKRIFHIVRPHVRATGSAVKMHFRGLRDFHWNGYEIKITVPVRDHVSPTDFNVGLVDLDESEDLTGTLTMGQMGAMFRDHIIRGKSLSKALDKQERLSAKMMDGRAR